MIDARIANNIIGFMERAPLKAGVEVPAFNEARASLESIIKSEDEANDKKLKAAAKLAAEKKKAEEKKKPRRKKDAEADDES